MKVLKSLFLISFLALTGTTIAGCEAETCVYKGDPNVPVGGAFALTNQAGERVTDAAFKGKYRLVYFGFTFCPDICPVDLQKISSALDMAGEDTSAIQPLFITIDPARDDVDAMATYLQHFHPSLVGLTGTDEEIAAAAGAYRVYYAKEPNAEDPESYLMNHSSNIYLMDCDGLFIRHFTSDATAEEIADVLKTLI